MSLRDSVFTLPAMIRGHGRERFCTVTATMNTGSPKPSDFFMGPIKVLDATDDFADGNYELILGSQKFLLTKVGGVYHSIP